MQIKEEFIKDIEIKSPECDFPFYSRLDSLEIDEVINALNDLRFNGASKVYFYPNSDRKSYFLSGVKIEEVAS